VDNNYLDLGMNKVHTLPGGRLSSSTSFENQSINLCESYYYYLSHTLIHLLCILIIVIGLVSSNFFT
jgi:hypothetical protein